MNRTWTLLLFVAPALAALGQTGCVGEVMQQAQTAAKRQQVFEELKRLGLARINFHDQNNRFPNSWEELQSVGVDAGLRQKLEGEGYTVILGMKFSEMMAGTSNFMHAYPRDAAQNGGLVGHADGSVRQVTAAEFKELWDLQEPTMKNAIILEAPGATVAAPAGGGSAPPPPPAGGGSAPPPPPPASGS
jgi:hypothetical protein